MAQLRLEVNRYGVTAAGRRILTASAIYLRPVDRVDRDERVTGDDDRKRISIHAPSREGATDDLLPGESLGDNSPAGSSPRLWGTCFFYSIKIIR
jgi:hypothetical protein